MRLGHREVHGVGVYDNDVQAPLATGGGKTHCGKLWVGRAGGLTLRGIFLRLQCTSSSPWYTVHLESAVWSRGEDSRHLHGTNVGGLWTTVILRKVRSGDEDTSQTS